MQLSITLFLLFTISLSGQNEWMEDIDFVYLDEYLINAKYEVRYHGSNNFVGDTIKGYSTDRLVMTRQAAEALQQVEKNLAKKGYALKVFDTYRPQRAVNHFKEWATDIHDTLTKKQFYPNQDKRRLFDLGYISSRSGHSRGSTIDLTMIRLDSEEEVDMGSPYDFFGNVSHHNSSSINSLQMSNRRHLRAVMKIFGFRAYSKEWWHYTLNVEPYKDRYFDYVVSPTQ